MNNRFRFEENEAQSFKPDEISKAIALVFVQDAIANEQYEAAAEYLQSARASGASLQEVDAVIASVFDKTDNTIVRFGAYEETE